MSPTWLLDDQTIDALVDGRDVHDWLAPLATFARQARTVADAPPPAPTAELRALLGADVLDRQPTTRHRRTRTAVAKVAGLGLVAKVALATSVAAATATVAGVTGVLPDAAGDGVRRVVEAVSPIELDEPADRGGSGQGGGTDGEGSGEPDPAGDAESFGDRVSDDATGESDGVPGVDGGDVSADAPGADNRPSDVPAGPGDPDNPSATAPGDPPAGGTTPPTTTPPVLSTVPSTVPPGSPAGGAPGVTRGGG
jgi:hypothetical protein